MDHLQPPNIALNKPIEINGWDPKHQYQNNKPLRSSSPSSIISFMASLITSLLIIYISLAYIHNPNFFWWLISNNLVLIIASDYAAAHDQSHYDDDDHHPYGMKRRTRFPPPALLTRRNSAPGGGIARQSNVDERGQRSTSILKPKGAGVDGIESAQLCRSQSQRRGNKKVVIDESRNIVRRFERVVPPPPDDDDRLSDHGGGDDEEDSNNEYAKLSTEELNKRMEDFIQRFNTQIRLQNQIEG